MSTSKPNKIKKSIWLTEETWKKIDQHREYDAHESIAQFIEQAVKDYCCKLDSNANSEVLGPAVIGIIRANLKNAENHIASCIFKLAGEQATLNLLIADQLIGDMDAATVRAYRNEAYDIVRKRHGVFNFEDAMENAKEVADSEN